MTINLRNLLILIFLTFSFKSNLVIIFPVKISQKNTKLPLSAEISTFPFGSQHISLIELSCPLYTIHSLVGKGLNSSGFGKSGKTSFSLRSNFFLIVLALKNKSQHRSNSSSIKLSYLGILLNIPPSLLSLVLYDSSLSGKSRLGIW